MTREQIAKAAMDYAVENSWYPGETSYESDIKAMEESFADAFRDGAEWCINSVWHDVSERPKFPGELEAVKFLLLQNNGECDRYLIDKYGWDAVMGMAKFVKWAYLKDLRPEIKEETK